MSIGLELVEQESWNDCAPACLAMVSGRSLAAVKDEVAVPTTHAEMHGFLLQLEHATAVHLLLLLEDLPIDELRRRDDLFVGDAPFEERTLILTVESPNPEVEWHSIVVHEGTVYDPKGLWTDLDAIGGMGCTWGFDIDLDTDSAHDLEGGASERESDSDSDNDSECNLTMAVDAWGGL